MYELDSATLAHLLADRGFLTIEQASDREIKAALEDYQLFHGLHVDGVAGPVTERSLRSIRYCTYDRLMATGELRKFPTLDVTVAIQDTVPGLSLSEMQQAIKAWLDEWNKLSAFTATLSSNPKTATVKVTAGSIDGPGNTLAWAELAGDTQKFDTKERWRYGGVFTPVPSPYIDFGLTWGHEWGHSGGLDHAPGQNNLLSAIYDPRNFRLGAWEKAEMVKRYGERSTPAPTPDPDQDKIVELRLIVPATSIKIVPA